MRYSVQPTDRIFIKGYEIFSFAKNMGKYIGKNISKIFGGKQILKLLDYAKKSATDPFKTASKRGIRKSAEATGDFIGFWQQNNSETVTNEHNKELPKERQISLEERQKIIEGLR